MHNRPLTECDALELQDRIPLSVTYFNHLHDSFYPGAVVFCTGSLSIVEHASGDPALALRAQCMLRWVVCYQITCVTRWLTCLFPFSCPGDPSDDAYYDSTPPLANAALNFVGPVSYHHLSDSGVRLFGVDLSVYKEKVQDKIVMQDFHIACLFDPDSPRWKNYCLPHQLRHVHVSGKTVGFAHVDGCQCLCVLILDLSYLPTSLVLPSTPSTV